MEKDASADISNWHFSVVPRTLSTDVQSFCRYISTPALKSLTVASLGGRGKTAPDDTIQGVAPEWNYFVAAEFAQNTGETTMEGRRRGGVGDETIAKKDHHFSVRGRWLKGRHLFWERVTPSVAAPGDTNLSDAADV